MAWGQEDSRWSPKQVWRVLWVTSACVSVQFVHAMHVTHRQPPITCKVRKLRSGDTRETCKPDLGQPVYTFNGFKLHRDRLRNLWWPYNYWTDEQGNIKDPQRNKPRTVIKRHSE